MGVEVAASAAPKDVEAKATPAPKQEQTKKPAAAPAKNKKWIVTPESHDQLIFAVEGRPAKWSVL